jgi:hypothetical protein
MRFMLEHMLGEAEMVIIVHLLFKELYEGNAYADAAELMRLVSADEAQLIESRRFMAATGTLRRREIIEVEPMLEGRELTGEVHLADWVVNSLFGPPGNVPERAIAADERLAWHQYLHRLGESERFYRDLEN